MIEQATLFFKSALKSWYHGYMHRLKHFSRQRLKYVFIYDTLVLYVKVKDKHTKPDTPIMVASVNRD